MSYIGFAVFKRNKETIKLAMPVFLQLLLGVAMGYVNQFMLAGQPLASNAVSQANQIANIFIVFFSVFSSSSVILITNLIGAKQEGIANKIYALSFWLNALLGLLVAVVVMFLSPYAFVWMGVDSNVQPYADNYQLVSGPSIAFLALTQVFAAYLRANKKMVEPTIIYLLSNVVAAGGNAIVLWVIPGLSDMDKLIGVGIVTDLSRLLALALSFWYYVRYIHVSLGFKILRPFPAKLLARLAYIGLPTAGETLSYNMTQLVLVAIVNYSVPVLEQNLRNYLLTFFSLIYLFANGIAAAMQVIEGNAIGAKDKEEAYRLVKDTGTMARTVSLGMSLLLTAIAFPLFSALMAPAVDDPLVNIQGLTYWQCGLMALYCMLIDIVLDQGRATNLVYVCGLETAGDIMFPVMASIVASWLFTAGGAALFCMVFKWGIYGAFAAAALDECSRALAFVIRWERRGWYKRTLTKGI